MGSMFDTKLPAAPGSKAVIVLGLLASVIAGVAIAEGDRVSAGWAGAALFMVGLWLVWPQPVRQRR